MAIARERLSRRKLLAGLPDPGAPGRSIYAMPGEAPPLAEVGLDPDDADGLPEICAAADTGAVVFASGADVTLIIPPFPVEASVNYSELHTKPLIDLLQRRRTVAVFLLRLGGFSVGVLRDGSVADSKTDQRFVKNRHRKGGQSQRRFERIREKQIHELFGKACEEAHEKLEPHRDEIEHVFLGGDRHTLQAFRKECTYFERYGARVRQRVLPVAGDPRRASLDAAVHEIWCSDVYRAPRR